MPPQPGASRVILVDAQDRPVGECDKLDAHRRGVLHRAVSVFAFDPSGRLLVQQRAPGKYHSGGLWSNSACTHPRRGESLESAARRAMREELGVSCDDLRYAFPFTYRADVGGGLTEHEYDHVFVCRVSERPRPSPDEVSATDQALPAQLQDAMRAEPGRFTPWFRMLLEPVLRWRKVEGGEGREGRST
jgi:isopentenyl-diphosphate delta-isomerase